MVLSNAERQARYQKRLKKRMQDCVTAEDVVRAVRLMYDEAAQYPDNQMPPYEEWISDQRKAMGGGDWRNMLPDSLEPLDYEDFATDDAALLLRVAKVVHAIRFPPAD